MTIVPAPAPVKLFYCYAHNSDRDSKLKEELHKHIRDIPHVETRGCGDIPAGGMVEKVINDHLAAADIILLLVSPDFPGRDRHAEEQVNSALARSAAKKAEVVPIILRPYNWKVLFGTLQVLPRGGSAVSTWINHDVVFDDIGREIYQIVQDRATKREQIVKMKEAHLAHALLYHQQKNYQKALNAYEMALDCLPDNLSAHQEKSDIFLKIATIHYECAQWQLALEICKNALKLSFNNPHLHTTMGSIHLQLSDLGQAIADYEQAIKLEPHNSELFAQQSTIFLRWKKPGEALAVCEKALVLDSSNAHLMRCQGKILCSFGTDQRYREALAAYEAALRHDPHNPYLYKDYGDALCELKLFKEALDAYGCAEEYGRQQDQNFLELVQQAQIHASEQRTAQLRNKSQLLK